MKSTLLTLIILAVGTVTAAASPWEDDDDYDVWEPVYSTPAKSPRKDKAKICLSPDAPELLHPAQQTEPIDIAPVAFQAELSPESILGEPQIDARTLWLFVRRHNTDFPIEIAEAFLTIGRSYGIRGDVALCQAIIETGWFRFADGTAVTPDQHNYCGLGVTGRGQRGASFETIEDGVRAHLQHLYAYASTAPLPSGEPLLDPRFSLVKRGVASSWHDLSNRWAMNPNYGHQILTLYSQLCGEKK